MEYSKGYNGDVLSSGRGCRLLESIPFAPTAERTGACGRVGVIHTLEWARGSNKRERELGGRAVGWTVGF